MRRLTTMLSARAAAFRTSRRGSIPILFALGLLPVVGLIGLGIDYGVAASNKSKLDTAADAAAIAAVVTAKAYLADNAGQTDVTAKAIAAGIAKATNAFRANMGTVALTQLDLPTPQLTRNAQTLTAVVSYSAAVRNTFGPLFGSPSTTLSNTATASADVASYLDFYLMVDVSGSMGLPTTTSGMTRLAQINRDGFDDFQQGCMFACHYPGSNGWYQAVHANPPIQLRSNAVNDAVCALLQRATNSVVPNQYRIGIYPFINQLATLTNLTGNLATLNTAAQCAQATRMTFTDLLDTGTTQLYTNNDPSTGTGAGGSHFEIALPQMQATIKSYGTGSTASDAKPFVFLITDGMQNSMHYATWKNGKYIYSGNSPTFPGYDYADFDGSKPAPLDPSLCTSLKNAGATLSILYIPYTFINFINNGGINSTESAKVNSFSPTLATPLRNCASAGFFFTASTPADITAALSAMLDKSLQVARITK